MTERRGQLSSRGGDAGPRQGGNVGASERGCAQGGFETLGVEQTVGAILVVGPGERCAKFPQDERFRGRLEIAVAPQGADDPCPFVEAPSRVRSARGGDHSRACLRRLAGEIRGDLRRRLGTS